MELSELLERVEDRESFFLFVRALITDREDAVARQESGHFDEAGDGWESNTIEQYLEAALAWAEATRMGVTRGLPEEPSWKAFAVFLYLGENLRVELCRRQWATPGSSRSCC